jgi:hypothetical protein
VRWRQPQPSLRAERTVNGAEWGHVSQHRQVTEESFVSGLSVDVENTSRKSMEQSASAEGAMPSSRVRSLRRRVAMQLCT